MCRNRVSDSWDGRKRALYTCSFVMLFSCCCCCFEGKIAYWGMSLLFDSADSCLGRFLRHIRIFVFLDLKRGRKWLHTKPLRRIFLLLFISFGKKTLQGMSQLFDLLWVSLSRLFLSAFYPFFFLILMQRGKGFLHVSPSYHCHVVSIAMQNGQITAFRTLMSFSFNYLPLFLSFPILTLR